MTIPAFGQADINDCDREPIHIPGSIQPHGALVTLDPQHFVVLQVAGNTVGLLHATADQLLGQPIADWIGPGQLAVLQDALKAERRFAPPLAAFCTVLDADQRLLNAMVHAADGVVLLELEPPTEMEQTLTAASDAVNAMRQYVRDVERIDLLCQAMCDTVQRLSGYPRVLAYRFHDDGTGEVFAEAVLPGTGSFKGLRYPASDIPAQARALYLTNRLRIIPDVAYTPAPLQPALNPLTGGPLDLSGSVLRSVSPLHVEYLTNMGVASSMSISLAVGDRLWGLIVCHGLQPHFVPGWQRAACELFGELASAQLETLIAAQDMQRVVAARTRLESLIQRIGPEHSIAAGLLRHEQDVLHFVDAAGLALYLDGQLTTCGATPDTAAILQTVEWLRGQDIRAFATHHLASLMPEAAAWAEAGSGLLALSLTTEPTSFVLWFRPELTKTVVWAGNPDKAVLVGQPGERLSPRKSFAAWQQQVRHQSEPWLPTELDSANSLRLWLLEVALRQSVTEVREREAARRHQNMLMAELDHRVKNMLATIQALVLKSRAGTATLEDFLATFVGRLHAMSRAHNLLTASRWEGADLHSVIREELAPYVSDNAHSLMLPTEPAVTLRPKAALAFSLAVHELATNAAKYGALSLPGGRLDIHWQLTDGPEPTLVFTWRESGGPRVAAPSRRGFGRTLIEKNLAYEIGGTVDLAFDPRGVTFKVVVPWDQVASATQPAAAPGAAAAPAAPLAGARILLVEDNGLIALEIVDSIESLGAFVVGPAARLAKAVELAETARIDAAVLDVDLDGVKTWPVADVLQRRGIPFVFSTGFQADLVMPEHLRGSRLITKPYKLDDLESILRQITRVT